ncbi:MAG: tripartite tricarboxylate transporter TctB family protein [Methylobacterium sp.]|nr:tripartite tricarboxylate transporter TctB family protein [Rhodobacter sp.]MCA3659208.1 tripartite tricarboxylate transporter TctB family protein [Methylobacterium sp.]MCA3663573.1 tripartite tricarboxylate transporter TctB family protein [Methylobacterium sp.]MCA3672381.1 tripartite tricarboxylate transporter TctB family protein [Methylobacterium sp.]MCA3673501.1 tripartite tricarboxylate transporter TctB family protein [Methylobacterium sp.]
MRLRAASGEIFLALAFVGAGAFWVLTALGMQLWEGFAPSSGFLPLVYGLLLMGLSVAALLLEARPNDRTEESNATIRQPLIVIAAMAAGVAGLEVAGFAVSIFLTMFFLLKVTERLPLLPSLLTAGGTVLILRLVFRTWLGVPLPNGPWGF